MSLELELGYNFNNNELLKLALTHRSMGMPNNERLEFVGDSILNFIIAEELFNKYPKVTEGVLSRMRASLVKGETLAKIAKLKNLGDYIILGPGEKRTGGHQRASILADCVEALIGAIYQDSDLLTVKQCVLAWYQAELANIKDTNLNRNKDAKTKLQELMQKKSLELPIYDIVEILGDAHEQEFVVSCKVALLNEVVKAQADTRKKAEQKAAEIALEMINANRS